MEVRIKDLPGNPVAEIEDCGAPAVSFLCDFCGKVPDWNTIGENVSVVIPWVHKYVAVDASAILEATPDELIIKTAGERLRRLPSMVSCWHCRKRHKRRFRKALKKVGLLLVW